MAGSVEWIFRMVDRVTAPARAAQKRLEFVEKTVQRVERVTRLSGGAFSGWARQGEQGARRVEAAFQRVQARVGGTHQGLMGLQGAVQGLALGAGAAAFGAGYAGKSVVDAAAYKQDQLTSLTGMLNGDRSGAGRLFGQAQAFAADTPFTTREILDATRQSVAIGFRPTQALPLVELAGSLSAGSGKSLDQVMEAFAALRGGDFGQAFGVGQGFSNLNISREMLRRAGLKFDAQGGYKGTIQEGMNAVAKIIRDTYGSAMAERSGNISGLASTLQSRPEELFMSLVDNRGQSRALRPLQDFMANLAELTDFTRGPGLKIQKRFEASMTRLFSAVFRPLANATEGDRGVALVDRLLDKLDEFSRWWSSNGPGVTANIRGFGQGLKTAADGAMFFLRPIIWVVDTLNKLSGGTGEGGLGKVLGFGAGLAAMGWVGNLLSFGVLGKLGTKAGQTLIGALKGGAGRAAQGLLTRGVVGEVLTNPLGRRAGLRAALPALRGRAGALAGRAGSLLGRVPALLGRLAPMAGRFLPWLGRIAAGFLGIGTPIGWIVLAVTGLVTLGVTLYNRWAPFRALVDRIADRIRGIPDALRALGGGNLLMGALMTATPALLIARLGRGLLGGLRTSMSGWRLPAPRLPNLSGAAGRMTGLFRTGLSRAGGLLARVPALLGRIAPFASRVGALLGRFAPLIARFLPWVARIGGVFLGLSNPIGWVITAVTAIVSLGRLLYQRWEPFRTFVDGLRDGFRGLVAQARDLGVNLLQGVVGFWDQLPAAARAGLTALIPGLGAGMSALSAAVNLTPTITPAVPPPAAPTSPIRPPTPTYTGPARQLTPIMQRSATVLTGIAQQIGIDPASLLAVAMKESTLNPAAVNADSGASGLIQFLPSTARALGTTVEALRRMTPEQQAPYILAYLKQAGVGAGSSLDQVYSAVFAGNASKAGRVLYTTADGKAYSDNQGLDLNQDGKITSAEAAQSALSAWQPYAAAFQPQITVHLHGPATAQAVQDVGAAAYNGAHQALSTMGLEQGHGTGRSA